MQKTFIESHVFTESVSDYLSDDEYAQLQQELLDSPDKGAVIPGCGGLRKLRVAQKKRMAGKRGGARVIYIHIPETNWMFLLDIYGKDERDDLSAREKTILKRMAEDFRKYALDRAHRRTRGRNS